MSHKPKNPSLGSLFQSIDTEFHQALKLINEGLRGFDIPDFSKLFDGRLLAIDAVLSRCFGELYEELDTASKRLAACGWTIPLNLDLRQIINLAEQSNSREEVDQFFVDYFTANEGRELEILRQDLLVNDSLKKWQPLLGDCFAIFEIGYHRPAIPALLSVLEGFLSEQSGTKKRLKVESLHREVERLSRDHKRELSLLGVISGKTFVAAMWQYASFEEAAPIHLNRHWILHGRDETSWTKADVLRLFNALHIMI